MPSTVKIKTQQSDWLVILTLLVFVLSSCLTLSNCSSQNGLAFEPKTEPGLGRSFSVSCKNLGNATVEDIWWSKGNDRIQSAKPENNKKVVTLTFQSLNISHISNYTCHAKFSNEEQERRIDYFLEFSVPAKIETSDENISEQKSSNVSISCNVTGYPLTGDIWWKFQDKQKLSNDSESIAIFNEDTSLTRRSSVLKIFKVDKGDNGTYHCHYDDKTAAPVLLKVLSEPTIKFDKITALGKSEIFVNWTLYDGNSPVKDLILSYKQAKEAGERKIFIAFKNTTHHILKDLRAGTPYTDFTITATNDIGNGTNSSPYPVTTLLNDTVFIPSVTVVGSTWDSVTISVTGFEGKVAEFYHYVNVSVRSEDGTELPPRIEREKLFMITSLEPGKSYSFEVKACSDYTKLCGEPSKPVTHRTLDGKPSPPQEVDVRCQFDDKTNEATVTVKWTAPKNPRGTIEEYLVSLKREAIYVDGNGEEKMLNSTSAKTLKANIVSSEFPNEPANTNFTVSVCAKTKFKMCGESKSATCVTPEVPPSVADLNQASWKPMPASSLKRVIFLVNVPRISQRNGPICCFRIVVVKLQKGHDVSNLVAPEKLQLQTYEEVHSSVKMGAYVAEVMNASNLSHLMTQKSMVFTIGDEENPPDGEDKGSSCRHCYGPSHDMGVTGIFRKQDSYPSVDSPEIKNHKKRHTGANGYYPVYSRVRDGPLNPENVYTAYLDAVIVTREASELKRKSAHSDYFRAFQPKFVEQAPDSAFNDFLKPRNLAMLVVGSMVVTLMTIFMALICIMRWRRKEPGDQEYGLSHSVLTQFRMCFRGQELVPHEMPDQPSIAKDMLVAAYQERHENCDAGFQKEFSELPERFKDRTTDASAKNLSKNRYPDIRAYDQTRVKLSTADGGSDYINANFVMGYEEHKKFICAQGPMESTVVDWWRMIWEQRVHLLIMLTNIEEYSKTKCAKYWPSEGSSEYGSITVTHMSEKRYSDYLVRSLKLRLNGPDGDSVKEERDIEQYHYLVWKDYMAPEHPVGIIRFIKRINEVNGSNGTSIEKGPILVHCSAGVGRTGTLVALDSLLQQLDEEGCVSILKTVCKLRHQRNYLVQSLKQYIFIYRALMEAALFGDTEIAVSDLKSHIERLKAVPEGKAISRLQEEFERLSQVIEDRKPIVTGSSEENRHRNRHENVIPYDRNRVHLFPVPGLNKEICTYINASFIEGYDSSEQYIIAQDPLESTVGDFWRMIVEQNIRSVVMLSEVGDDKCPRYWPEKDQETSHDYIRVKYMQSQSFPFYYRREFTVTNTKAEDSCLVTQFQYNGWPVGETAVPESSRGMVELIDTTFKHKETLDKVNGPTLIHCSAGADRSCIFVALAILVRQMMNESRVDVFSVIRKLRSQRQGLFQNLAQYEFVYRGLDLYADLHVANGNASH